ISPRLEALPADVLELHPDLGESAFAMVIPAGPGSWVLALLSGDELAEQAAAVDDELDVALAVGDSPVGASTVRDGNAVDLDAVPSDARTVRPFDIDGGPLLVTVADIDGLAGGGWREPGLLLGAGLALSILVGALVLVLAQGRAGALRVASEAQLARDRSEENFRAVVQHLSDLVLVTDASTMISFVTPSVARLLGREASSLPGGFLGDLVHPDDRALLAALTSRSGVSEKGLIRFRHSDGSDRSFEVVVANRLEDPAIGGLVLTAHDVTDRVKLEDRLAHEATHDDLTGLPNRALIHDRLEHALLRADRTGGRVAVVFGDLDSFKPINDKYGHLIGDRLLQGVARRMRGAARAMDTVGRYGGDEFVVVCEELEDEAGARLAAERLHQEVARPLDVDLTMLDVAMSLGVALAAPGESAESVMHRADQAMYRAKAEQRITFAA
ncbi:MAG: sensor domain-containing diguanylate cyclase, partial [Acidimicrobiales bacterium]